MTGSGVLAERLREAIDSSSAMVLLASPASARSAYVDLEVDHFVTSRGVDRLIIVVIGGDPGQPPELPPTLRERRQELLWVDCRGKRRMTRQDFVRVVAAMLDVDFDLLWRRHRRRRHKIAAAWCATAALLVAVVGTAVWQQRAAEQQQRAAEQQQRTAEQQQRTAEQHQRVAEERSPEQQRAVFQRWILGKLRHFSEIPVNASSYRILRTDDLNDDGLIDYFINNDAYCGSGGCPLEVYVTNSPGSYTMVLDVQGSSNPTVRSEKGGEKEIVAPDLFISGQPVYSVYRWRGSKYALDHYEFCQGVILEQCDPLVIEPLPPSNGLVVARDAKFRERPAVDARPTTIGGGDRSGQVGVTRVHGALPNHEWYLVSAWKGSCGFVSASDMTG